jgi:hypothetical protein
VNIPGWLDPAAEIQRPEPPKRDDRAFVRRQMALLASFGLPHRQCLEGTAIACTEGAWGGSRGVAAHNLCGVKARRDIAEPYRLLYGRPQPWFRASGHTKQRDPKVVLYAAWHDDSAFWRFWLARYVGPAAGVSPEWPQYADAGLAFWHEPHRFVRALIAAGYRGQQTAGKPEGSIATHASVVARVARLAGAP